MPRLYIEVTIHYLIIESKLVRQIDETHQEYLSNCTQAQTGKQALNLERSTDQS